MPAGVSRLIVGLTGGIGSGKSAAAECFAKLGVTVIDTDAIARELTTANGEAMPALRMAFGVGVVAADGSLDRPAMRQLAFSNTEVRRKLEAILHPMIRAVAEARCRQALEAGAPYVVLVVPLLIESRDYRQRVDRVAVVDCEDEVRFRRVMARSGLDRPEVERIMAAQLGRRERLAAADDVIDNNGSLEDMAKRVADCHRLYLGLVANSAENPATG